jgi:hypothetical protein
VERAGSARLLSAGAVASAFAASICCLGPLALAPERLAALTRDLAAVLARHLTRDSDEECGAGRDAIERKLEQAAIKHLNREQLAELRKAGEQGAQALPGEEK